MPRGTQDSRSVQRKVHTDRDSSRKRGCPTRGNQGRLPKRLHLSRLLKVSRDILAYKEKGYSRQIEKYMQPHLVIRKKNAISTISLILGLDIYA